MGLGFTLVITVIGAIRELIGNGTIFGKVVFNPEFQPALIMILPPGGFITIGLLMAFLHYFQNKAKEK
jgi:electron transport complex protein RnfE